MSTRNILQIDRESTAPFQNELHINPEVDSWFSFNKSCRTSAPKIKTVMEKTPKGEGVIAYTCSNKYDFIFNVEGCVKLPSIKVKDEWAKYISIKYPHNPGHNIFIEGEFKIDDEHKETIDSKYIDANSQVFVTKRRTYNEMIGNVPALLDWNTELPGIPLTVPLPFFFTKSAPKQALPILKGNNKITFDFKLRLKICDLLVMRIKNGDTYKEIPCKLKYLDCKSEEIPVPELWGYYSEITEAERNWRRSINPNTKEQEKLTLYTEDVDIITSDNPTPMGSKVSIKLESMYPAKYFFWMAQLENGGMSNYTTNKDDPKKGWNPCAKSAIKYGLSNRVPESDHIHFDQSEIYQFFPGEPCDAGYNGYSFMHKPQNIQTADNAVILNKCGAILEVILGDTNPFSKPEEEKEYYDEDGNAIPSELLEDDVDIISKKDKYTVHVRVVVMRKMEVSWDEKKNCLKYIMT